MVRRSCPWGASERWQADDLIHTVSRPAAWDDWYRARGQAAAPAGGGLRVGHFYVALQMARRHRGIALVPTVHLNALEWRDELVCPCVDVLRSQGGFYLLYRAADRQAEAIVKLCDWLRQRGDVSVPLASLQA